MLYDVVVALFFLMMGFGAYWNLREPEPDDTWHPAAHGVILVVSLLMFLEAGQRLFA